LHPSRFRYLLFVILERSVEYNLRLEHQNYAVSAF